jgi:uncharacterized protein
LRRTALSAERSLVYADSSALVKLVVAEPESSALKRHLGDGLTLATSRIAVVEVIRAVSVARPTSAARIDAERLLGSCRLIEVNDAVLRSAADLASASVRALDAIHLASALRIETDELVSYDRRLAAAGAARGLTISSPGAARPPDRAA